MVTKIYTAGAFAKKAGVSIRTVQYYDKIGVLKPAAYSESGQRQYNDNDFERLQRILMLKYLGFSLGEIVKLIQTDSTEGFDERLNNQKNALMEKMDNIKGIINTIERAQSGISSSKQVNWDIFIDIINSLKMDSLMRDQYKNSENLQARIRLHSNYSTSKIGWYQWLLNMMDIQKGSKILEIGCGDASFWRANSNQLPESCHVILSDKSEGMLSDAKKNLQGINYEFEYNRMGAENIIFEDNRFDVVIANHVLFYIMDRRSVLSEIRRVLRPGGKIITSTIGINHMKELHNLMIDFSKDLVMSDRMPWEDYGLHNGKQQLEEYFKNVKTFVHEDSLLVTEPESIVDYVMSTHGNAHEILKGKKYHDFFKYVKDKFGMDKSFEITKESGVFIGEK